MRATQQWADALAAWAIPEEILRRAPVPPWVHPPAMFTVDPDAPVARTPSVERELEALGAAGTVLDVGCGGGGSSIPLAAAMTALTGVDEQQGMLDNLRHAAERVGVPCTTVRGRWPDVADRVPAVDLVVSHHVVFNVADIAPFVRALHDHARRRVVVELPDRHPTSPFNPLWRHFWGLERPTEPSAALFAEVVTEVVGAEAGPGGPRVERWSRPPRTPRIDTAGYVAFVRTRLCLTPDRDAEVVAALEQLGPPEGLAELVTVWWDR